MANGYVTPAPEQSVLLTIDVQRDFFDPGSSAAISATSAVVRAMQRLLRAYRKRRLPIVHVVRLYLADGANDDIYRREMIGEGKSVVRSGTQSAELIELLKLEPNTRLNAGILLAGKLQKVAESEWVMYKPRWDAFYRTPLEKHLRNLAVTTVVVVGCNFPNCPRATIYGASMRDFRTVLISDAVSGLYDRALKELSGIAVVTLTTNRYLDWLEGPELALQEGLQ